MKSYFRKMRGSAKCPPRKPFHKILWSWLGAFVGMYLLAHFGQMLALTPFDCLFVIGSFGASAVLVYGAPLAELSQPRNLVGGHVVSAVVGVLMFRMLHEWAPESVVSASAVSLSIVAMHLTRTLHPPGGATSLIAVIGGDKIHSLGFLYVLSPVLVSTLVLLCIALIVNNLSSDPRRHYPQYWI